MDRNSPAPQNSDRNERENTRGAGGAVLLVEDDTIMRQILANVLDDAGYQVTPAADGNVAIKLLEQQQFDVVVTDIRMREVDGVEVLKIARGLSLPPEVILLTGYGSLETAVAALRAGAFNYLLKPCVSTELLECVQGAVRRHHANRRRIEAMQVLAEEYAQIQQTIRPAVAQPPGARRPEADEADARFLQVGALRLDLFRHVATFENELLHLTPIEYAFLCCLAENVGRVQRCDDIVRRTHGYETSESEAQVLLRAHVRNLRRKLPPSYLVTVRSIGYMLVNPNDPQSHEL